MKFSDMPKTRRITYFAILTALVLLLQFTASAIKIGAVTLNFVLIPIVVCGMLLGVLYGALLGFVAGVIILLAGVIGMDGFTNVMFAEYPVGITLICILKTTFAGAAGAFVYGLLKNKNKYAAAYVSSAIVPIVNTGTFIIGMLFMKSGLVANGFIDGGKFALWAICVGLVTFNFFFELGINLLLAPALYRCVTAIDKAFGVSYVDENNENNGEDK